MNLAPADLILFLEKHARHPLTAREIFAHFELDRGQRQEAKGLLDALTREGTLVLLKGERYSLPRQVDLAVGKISVHRDGYGFVVSEDNRKDTFVPARFMREVMNGDRVVARIERGGRVGSPEGRIIRVLERAHQTVVGRFEASRKFGYVVPADPRLGQDILITGSGPAAPKAGQMVIARIDVYPTPTRSPEGTIIEVLGDPDDPQVEILAIVHKHQLPHQFPPEVLAAAEAIPERVDDQDVAAREDLRPLPFVTIDGETAKDFDDAVCLRVEKGNTRLWVAIADVAHYVTEGSIIDREAYERGTSVYFPGQAIPMLPEKLSNGLCSLNPELDRLVMVAEILFDREGRRLESRFYPATIRSHARLTYTEVRDMVVDGHQETISRYNELFPQLQRMGEFAEKLTAMRRRRGSLDFDLPEAEIVLDLRGRPENIIRAERHLGHRLIEEFMLAANEAVATFLTERKAPLLYRVHEPPDAEKLLAFQQFIAHFNYGLEIGPVVDPGKLQRLLAEAAGKPEERMINQVLLRSMRQARYSPENAGHFGLAADLYCHFTSPIRRYPDLIVHRVLREVLRKGKLAEKRRDQLQQTLPEVGEQSSQRERRAMEAEREIVVLKKCQFMAQHAGEEFAGFISGVLPFGFFVELKEFFVEGLVRISSLNDDFYHYEEDLHRLVGQHRRRIFQIGQEVKVSVKTVNLERREIDLLLSDLTEEVTKKTPAPRRRTGRKPR